jgi:hypothetical protein
MRSDISGHAFVSRPKATIAREHVSHTPPAKRLIKKEIEFSNRCDQQFAAFRFQPCLGWACGPRTTVKTWLIGGAGGREAPPVPFASVKHHRYARGFQWCDIFGGDTLP